MILREKERAETQMKHVQKIYEHPLFQESLKANRCEEQERVYCRHDMTHFLDVARIAWILVLEYHLDVEKEWVYAAALLHDIGRWKQYREGIPHDEASVQIGKRILVDVGFSKQEQEQILGAISAHRNKTASQEGLEEIIFAADKLSRPCYDCKAKSSCNWETEKKNMHIIF